MSIIGRKRSGGPRTENGKARSSGNAFKTGIAVNYWLNDAEQAEYDELMQALAAEYQPATATARLLVERLASQQVKLRRLGSVENALHERARITASHVAREQAGAEHSLASYLPATDAARQLALRVAAEGALPDLERLSLLGRYQCQLEGSILRLIAEIRRRTDEDRKAAASNELGGSLATARPKRLASGAEVEDAKFRSVDGSIGP